MSSPTEKVEWQVQKEQRKRHRGDSFLYSHPLELMTSQIDGQDNLWSRIHGRDAMQKHARPSSNPYIERASVQHYQAILAMRDQFWIIEMLYLPALCRQPR